MKKFSVFLLSCSFLFFPLSDYVRSGIILGLFVTGALLVIRNLPGIYLSAPSIVVLDIAHIALCVALIVVSLVALPAKKRWLE